MLQVLEYIFAIGRLPLRNGGVAAMEVGAGPAPALYAIHDFCDDLVRWPGRHRDWSTGPLEVSDALDRAPGWDHFMHGLSEHLIAGRRATPASGQLSFRRALSEFAGLNIPAIHHDSIASLAANIEAEFDRAEEPISQATARKFAYEQGTNRPSAYDLIFVPDFLTQADATQTFQAELRRLMRSLTPGGVLAVLSGTADQYVKIRSALETLARGAGLTAVSPPEPMEANVDEARRAIVAGQVRATIAPVRAACSQAEREPFRPLSPDVIDPSVAFTLPRFRVLAFVNQRRSRTWGRGDGRLPLRPASSLRDASAGIAGSAGSDVIHISYGAGGRDLMPSDELSVPVTEGRFRERRVYLSPAAFADPGDGNHTPNNLIDRQVWMHLMDLPTDVLLQTTDHFGSTFLAMRSISHMWISGIMPAGTALPLVFDAYLDAYDEFEAAPFIAAHGWYRQATAGLRNALEVMAHAARFAVRGERTGYAAWRKGTADPPKFQNSVELIGGWPSVATVETALPAGAIFGRNPDGVLRALYQELCRFAHGHPGHTNAEIWESNGPVFVPAAFTQFWRDFRDTFVACSILLKIAHPGLGRPVDLPEVAAHAGAPWHGIAPSAVSAYFPRE